MIFLFLQNLVHVFCISFHIGVYVKSYFLQAWGSLGWVSLITRITRYTGFFDFSGYVNLLLIAVLHLFVDILLELLVLVLALLLLLALVRVLVMVVVIYLVRMVVHPDQSMERVSFRWLQTRH